MTGGENYRNHRQREKRSKNAKLLSPSTVRTVKKLTLSTCADFSWQLVMVEL